MVEEIGPEATEAARLVAAPTLLRSVAARTCAEAVMNLATGRKTVIRLA